VLSLTGRIVAVVLLLMAIGSIVSGPVLWVYSAWNLLVATMYAIDKLVAIQNEARRRQSARKGKTWRAERWRISESKLLWASALFGAAGALCSMLLFWHKIRQKQFYATVPIMLAVHVGLLWWLTQAGGWLLTLFPL
jgi:uncharacterized membrane protein YsdA (DUF1294 family)